MSIDKAMQLMAATVQPPRFGVAPITAKRDVIHKPEVHNVAQPHRKTRGVNATGDAGDAGDASPSIFGQPGTE